jgi:hypothetical protein
MNIPAKDCTAEDLELSPEEAIELFDAWANSTLICPQFNGIGKIEIAGDTGTIDSKNLIFDIEKNPNTNPDIVDNFIKDFEVSTWAVNQMMDFKSYDDVPIKKQQKLLGSWLLNNERAQSVNLYMRSHAFETYDRLFNLKGYPSSSGLFYDIGHIIHRNIATDKTVRYINPNVLFTAVLWQHNEKIIHVREGYDMFGLLGDLGGIT